MNDGYDLREYERQDHIKEPIIAARKAHRMNPVFIVIICLVIILTFVIGVFFCKTEKLVVKGCTWNSESEMEKMLRKPSGTENLLYFLFYYRFLYKGEIPLADQISVRMTSLTGAEVTVHEKNVVGYISYDNAYIYVDDQGRMTELRADEPAEIPKIEGVTVDKFRKGELIPIGDQEIVSGIITICKAIRKAQITGVRRISCDEKGDFHIFTDTIEVRLGQKNNLDEKVGLAANLLQKLDGHRGILHLEEYNGSGGSQSFTETERIG